MRPKHGASSPVLAVRRCDPLGGRATEREHQLVVGGLAVQQGNTTFDHRWEPCWSHSCSTLCLGVMSRCDDDFIAAAEDADYLESACGGRDR